MTRYIVLGTAGILWAVMMLSLFRREVLPYFDYQTPPSYRDLLRDLRQPELTRGEIQAAGVKVGEIESMAERQNDGTIKLRTISSLKARIAAVGDPEAGGRGTSEIPIRLKSESVVDALYRLSRTWCEIDIGFGTATIQGVREDDKLKARLNVGQGKNIIAAVSQTIDMPKEGMIGDLFQPFPGGGSLYVGKKWKIPTMTADLTGPKLGWLYAAVTDREEILWRGEKVLTYRIEIRQEPTEEKRPTHISWCREDGIALRQQFTFQSLVYEIVLVTKEILSRGAAIEWNHRNFASRP